MRLNLVLGFILISFLAACDRPPVAAVTTPPTPPSVASEPLGHFRLKILLAHVIEKSGTALGSPVIKLKAYPSTVVAQADFFLPEGPRSQALAALPDGHLLLLQLVDLKLAPERAVARQYLFDGNFQVESAVGQMRAWPYSAISSVPPPTFLKDVSRHETLTSLGHTVDGATLNAALEYDLTYLGQVSSGNLLQKSVAPEINVLHAGFKQQAEADLAQWSATTRPAP